MIEILICDNEDLHNYHIKSVTQRIISRHNLDAKVVMATNEHKNIIEYSRNNRNVKLFMLDIDLNAEVNGIDVAAKIRETDLRSYIVYITAHVEYSLTGYKTNTFDFLLKPLNEEILEKTILAIFRDYKGRIEDDEKKVFWLKAGSVTHRILYDNIVYFRKNKNLIEVITENGILAGYGSFKDVKASLPQSFVECHRSFIVSKGHLTKVDLKRLIVFMDNGDYCPISRGNKKLFEEDGK